jgi:hypothetical protein
LPNFGSRASEDLAPAGFSAEGIDRQLVASSGVPHQIMLRGEEAAGWPGEIVFLTPTPEEFLPFMLVGAVTQLVRLFPKRPFDG